MRFDEAYDGWQKGSLSQAEAGQLPSMSERNFRRYIDRFHEVGETGLPDQATNHCTPLDEVMKLTDLYRSRYYGWNVNTSVLF